jgi:CRISPR-associated protein Cas1
MNIATYKDKKMEVFMGSTRYIMSMGELSRKDNSLCFRKNNKNTYIPIQNTKEIFCLNEISINTKILDFLSRNNVIMHFYNYFGNYSGTFYPKDQYMSGKLLIKQVEKFSNNRMSVAKAIVSGIGENILEVLYHYYKHSVPEVKPTIDWIRKSFMEDIMKCDNVKQLMAIEGEVWHRFYQTFQYFLSEDFIINKRVKRPPDNPINAMISFGNTLLYTKTISAIYRTHLDQRISFLHEPVERRFSLSLDISEVFKPVLVYKTIFELVNRRRIQVDKHFEKNVNYCLLNEDGKKIFVEAYEARLESVFQHPGLKRKVTYRTAIKLDCYKLIKFIMEDKPFKPFSLKEGM